MVRTVTNQCVRVTISSLKHQQLVAVFSMIRECIRTGITRRKRRPSRIDARIVCLPFQAPSRVAKLIVERLAPPSKVTGRPCLPIQKLRINIFASEVTHGVIVLRRFLQNAKWLKWLSQTSTMQGMLNSAFAKRRPGIAAAAIPWQVLLGRALVAQSNSTADGREILTSAVEAVTTR